MNWSSTADFLAMGGYGLYVWGAFGITGLAMVAELLSLRARRRALRGREATHHDFIGSPHEA